MATILIIDDEPQIRSVLGELLWQAGHEVLLAENGRQGIEMYKGGTFDLVILDIFLPDKDGLETLNVLKSLNVHVNIIAMSGGFERGDINLLQMAQRLGAKRTLSKPFDMTLFLSVVEDALAIPNSSPTPSEPTFR